MHLSPSLADCVRLFRCFSLFVFHPGWWFGWWCFFPKQFTVGVRNSFFRGVRLFLGGGVRLSGCLQFICLPVWLLVYIPGTLEHCFPLCLHLRLPLSLSLCASYCVPLVSHWVSPRVCPSLSVSPTLSPTVPPYLPLFFSHCVSPTESPLYSPVSPSCLPVSPTLSPNFWVQDIGTLSPSGLPVVSHIMLQLSSRG